MTRGREFPHSKRAGRNVSEPMSSPVNLIGGADPVDVRGRPLGGAGITEVASIDSRGSRGGMFSKIDSPVLEIRESGLDNGACLGMKNTGMPCAGKPHARFDEGGLANMAMHRLLRHRQTKAAATDRSALRRWHSALYSTRYPSGWCPTIVMP